MNADPSRNNANDDTRIAQGVANGSNIYLTDRFIEATDDFGMSVRGPSPADWKDFFQTNVAAKTRASKTKASHYTEEFMGYRYRCCLANALGGWGITMRRLPVKVPSFRDDLGLDWNIIEPLTQGSGLTLFAGRMNSGKSTTMAAAIGKLDPQAKIATVEDPIELVYSNPSIIQREIGTHVDTFPEAIRDCVRQNRTHIVVSEIRDAETANAALLAASTGHSVFATIHADNAFDIYTRMLALVDQRYERLLARNLRGLWWQHVVRFGTRERAPLPVFESLLVDNEARLILEKGTTSLQMLSGAMANQGRKNMGEIAAGYVSRGRATRDELSEFLVRRGRADYD